MDWPERNFDLPIAFVDINEVQDEPEELEKNASPEFESPIVTQLVVKRCFEDVKIQNANPDVHLLDERIYDPLCVPLQKCSAKPSEVCYKIHKEEDDQVDNKNSKLGNTSENNIVYKKPKSRLINCEADKEIMANSVETFLKIRKEELHQEHNNNREFGSRRKTSRFCKILKSRLMNDEADDAKVAESIKKLEKLVKEHQSVRMCQLCHKSVPTKTHLMRHLNIKPYLCVICKKRFSQKTHLDSHSLLHLGIKPHQCDMCNNSFRHSHSLKKHKQSVHFDSNTPIKYFNCEQCGKSLKTKRSLQIHMLIHSKTKPFVCHICGSAFSQKANLINHIVKHSEARPIACDLCDSKFKTKKGLHSHMLVHSDKLQYSCNYCGERFKHRISLKHHVLIHSNVNPFVCNVCGAEFHVKNVFKQHLTRHDDSKTFHCNLCDKQFRVLSSLKTHIKHVHSQSSYECDKCGCKFSTRNYLRQHVVKTHTDLEPCVCENCGKLYKSKGSLQVHIKKHH